MREGLDVIFFCIYAEHVQLCLDDVLFRQHISKMPFAKTILYKPDT